MRFWWFSKKWEDFKRLLGYFFEKRKVNAILDKYNEPHLKHEQAGCALSILHHMKKSKTTTKQQQKITI